MGRSLPGKSISPQSTLRTRRIGNRSSRNYVNGESKDTYHRAHGEDGDWGRESSANYANDAKKL